MSQLQIQDINTEAFNSSNITNVNNITGIDSNTNGISTSNDLTIKYSNDGTKCPDYLAYDGTYYYLVNNDTLDNPGKIETYKTLQEAHMALEKLNCPKYNPISLVKTSSNNDPLVGIDRKCTKKVAINQFIEDIYNFSISEENRSAENLNKDLDIDKLKAELPGYLKAYNYDVTAFLGDKTPDLDDVSNKEEIQNAVNNYIKNASPEELSNYLQENCMINEYVAEYKGVQGGFYDNYNSINILDELENSINIDADAGSKESINQALLDSDARRDVEYPLMNEVWNMNKPITNLMMDKIFSV